MLLEHERSVLLGKVVRLVEKRPLIIIDSRQLSNSGALCHKVRAERPSILVGFPDNIGVGLEALDRNQPGPVDVLVLLEQLGLVDLEDGPWLLLLVPLVSTGLFIVIVDRSCGPQQLGPQVLNPLKHLDRLYRLI